jgi:DNA topoisomerase VI subunit A
MIATASNGARSTRRTRVDMAAIRDAIVEVLAEDHPQTVRQVFYR